MLEKTLENPLDCKEIQPVHPKGDQSWVFIGRTDVEAETPILWPPDGKSWLIWKDPDAGKDWGQEEKGTTEDEMVGWHHQPNGQEGRLQELVIDREAWRAAVHGVTKTDRLNWTGVPRGLSWWLSRKESTCNAGDVGLFPGSGRSLGGGHSNQSNILAGKIRKSHGQRSLICCSLWGHRVGHNWSN